MIVTSGENTSSITITPISNGAVVNVTPTTPSGGIEVSPTAISSIPAVFEQRVVDLENWSMNDLDNLP